MDGLNLVLIAFSIAIWPSVVSAKSPTTTSSSSATGAAPAFPTMSGQDGVGVPDGSVGNLATGNAGGNSGSSQGAFSLSTGAIIGISVAVGVTVIAIGKLEIFVKNALHTDTMLSIVSLWLLWFLAKRRNWNIRESIRRASRRLTGRRDTGTANQSSKANRRGTVMLKSPSTNDQRAPRNVNRDEDIEKGKAAPKPKPGWLAEEKDRSRSSSRENGSKKSKK